MNTPRPSTAAIGAPSGRRWPQRLLRAVLGLGIGLLVALAWLLGSGGGRDLALSRLQAALPPGALDWQRAEGALNGDLVLHGVRLRLPGWELDAARLELRLSPWDLPGGRLSFERATLSGARLTRLPDTTPSTPFRWPEDLPRLDLPLPISIAQLQVRGMQIRQQAVDGNVRDLANLQRLDAGLRLERGGLALTDLAIDSSHGRLTGELAYAPEDDFATRARLAWAGSTAGSKATLSAQGNLDDLALRINASQLDPAALGLDLAHPLDLRLDASSRANGVGVQGRVALGEQVVVIEPSLLALANGRLLLRPLALGTEAGRLSITGSSDLGDADPAFDLRLASDGLAWGEGAQRLQGSGSTRVQGRRSQWQLDGGATLQRSDGEATLSLRGQGNAEGLRLATLQATTPAGAFSGDGILRWTPAWGFALKGSLDDFDPGYLLPDYPGVLSGQVSVSGERDSEGQWRGEAAVPQLKGQLRGRALQAEGEARWDGHQGDGRVVLALGASRVTADGRFGDQLDVRAQFQPLVLADLQAHGSGRITGRLALRGARNAPAIDVDLRGQDLSWDGQQLAQATLQGHLPARGSGGRLQLQGSGLSSGGVDLDQLAVTVTGSQAAARIDAEAEAEGLGHARLAGELAAGKGEWRGRLSTLLVTPQRGPAWALQAPAAFRFGKGSTQLETACLVAGAPGGSLCVAASASAISVDGERLPLALLDPWLPDGEAPLRADGEATLAARFEADGRGQWRGQANLHSAGGRLALLELPDRPLLAYAPLTASATLANGRIEVELDAGLDAGGSITARLSATTAADGPLTGEARFDLRNLTWMELFSGDLATPVGRLDGDLRVAGTRAAPQLDGQARLHGFTAELPALGLKLADGDVRLTGAADGTLRLAGTVRSGAGVLAIEGSLNLRDGAVPLVARLSGERVTVASTAELFAIASPDLRLSYANRTLSVRGDLTLPEARFDLEGLDGSVAASPDVVVLDPRTVREGGELGRDIDVNVVLGDDVVFKGFGLNGRAQGSLRLRERPGRSALATGSIDVSGKYRAYGQALDIERGRLSYSNSPFDNPRLDLLAQRRFDVGTVGVRVRGTARAPRTEVVSSPAMDSSEALAWLVLGRPLYRANEREARQVGAAAVALGVGSNLLAQQVGMRLGLDEAGVTESRALGGSAFTVGKHLSPRLFISYGVSLVGGGQVVTLKYLLTRGFDISVETGTESAAALNYRLER